MFVISLHGPVVLTKKNHQFLIAAGGGGIAAQKKGDPVVPEETLPAPKEEPLKRGPGLAGATILRNVKKVDALGRKPRRALDGTAHLNPIPKEALLQKNRNRKQQQKRVWRRWLNKTTVSLTSWGMIVILKEWQL